MLATCVQHYKCDSDTCARNWQCDASALTPIDREYLRDHGMELRGSSHTATEIAGDRIREQVARVGDPSVGAQADDPAARDARNDVADILQDDGEIGLAPELVADRRISHGGGGRRMAVFHRQGGGQYRSSRGERRGNGYGGYGYGGYGGFVTTYGDNGDDDPDVIPGVGPGDPGFQQPPGSNYPTYTTGPGRMTGLRRDDPYERPVTLPDQNAGGPPRYAVVNGKYIQLGGKSTTSAKAADGGSKPIVTFPKD